jgi:hypothetical protein
MLVIFYLLTSIVDYRLTIFFLLSVGFGFHQFNPMLNWLLQAGEFAAGRGLILL